MRQRYLGRVFLVYDQALITQWMGEERSILKRGPTQYSDDEWCGIGKVLVGEVKPRIGWWIRW